MTQQLQASDIDDFNPVSHWSCDESSGVRYDSNTTNAYNLTDNNTVSSVAGLLSNACDFERDNSEYLSVSTITNVPDQNEARSISAWFNLESLNSTIYGYNVILDYGLDDTNKEFNLLYSDQGDVPTSNDRFAIDKYGSALNADLQVLSLATWYHVVLTYDTTVVRWYVNGTLVGSTTAGTIVTTGSDLSIGRRGAGAQSVAYFDGKIDEISIFPTALSQTDVTTLYNGGSPLPYSTTATSSTSTSATSTSTFEDDNIVFMLGVIAFFLTFLWFGFIVNAFKKI